MARTFGDYDAQVTLAHIARAWLRLADTIARERAQPLAQQQQQIQPKGEHK
jgi:hypothetical protein